jgi:hypothetical protein
MFQPVAPVQLRWLGAQEGGRKVLPSGPTYATTARFSDDPLQEQFSVVLQLGDSISADGKGNGSVKLSLVAPENLPEVKERLVPGTRLFIPEGAKIVAEATILDVERADVNSAPGR